jgi:hypothetical protein
VLRFLQGMRIWRKHETENFGSQRERSSSDTREAENGTRNRRGNSDKFFEENRRLLLQPLTLEYVMKVRGLLKGKPSPLETIMEERKREKQI